MVLVLATGQIKADSHLKPLKQQQTHSEKGEQMRAIHKLMGLKTQGGKLRLETHLR